MWSVACISLVLHHRTPRPTDTAVTARKIRPDIGRELSRIKMKGDNAEDKANDDKEKSLVEFDVRSQSFPPNIPRLYALTSSI